MLVEKGSNGSKKRGTSEPIRRFYVLKALAENYDRDSSSLASIHSVTSSAQRSMNRTLRDIDIRTCVEGLISRNLIEVINVDSGHAYRMTKDGYEFWKKNREALAMVIIME